MMIDIRMGTKHGSPALRRFAEHSLTHKLGARAERIGSAKIRLHDVNGPRGGVDKICHVRLQMPGGGEISASGESAGWYEAVTIAVMNVRATLDRHLDRTRTRNARGRHETRFMNVIEEESGRIPA